MQRKEIVARLVYASLLWSLLATLVLAGPWLRGLVAMVFAVHVLSGLLRAARGGRWRSFIQLLSWYGSQAAGVPVAVLILSGRSEELYWWVVGVLVFALLGLGLSVVSRIRGDKSGTGFPESANLAEYLSFSWLDRVEA